LKCRHCCDVKTRVGYCTVTKEGGGAGEGITALLGLNGEDPLGRFRTRTLGKGIRKGGGDRGGRGIRDPFRKWEGGTLDGGKKTVVHLQVHNNGVSEKRGPFLRLKINSALVKIVRKVVAFGEKRGGERVYTGKENQRKKHSKEKGENEIDDERRRNLEVEPCLKRLTGPVASNKLGGKGGRGNRQKGGEKS